MICWIKGKFFLRLQVLHLLSKGIKVFVPATLSWSEVVHKLDRRLKLKLNNANFVHKNALIFFFVSSFVNDM